MGHDTHFLTRLARVADGQVQLAMSLYRDPALMKEIFTSAAIPESAERVAISLADPVDGPFLVVQRNGHFVTCLGAGMRTDDLPLITRAKLDAVASRLHTLRERLELARQVSEDGREPEMHPVWTKLLFEPENICREDVAGLAVWLPMLRSRIYRMVAEIKPKQNLMAARLARTRGNPGARREFMPLYVRTMLHRATMIQLLLADPRALTPMLKDGDADLPHVAGQLLQFALEDALVLSCCAAFNGIIRGGKAYLPAIKRDDAFAWPRRLLLTGLGLSHEKCRAEIVKFLGPDGPRVDDDAYRTRLFERSLTAIQERVWTDCSARAAAFVERHPSPADLPPALALSIALRSDRLVDEPDGSKIVNTALALYAGAAPEDLYPPRDAFEFLPRVDFEELGERHIAETRVAHEPVVAQKQPGRNDPCSCGSGRKFKKCCGA